MRRSLLLFFLTNHHLNLAVSDSFQFPDYCGKIENGSFLQHRNIPPLSHNSGLQVIQVLTISRHGARAPITTPPCWPNYDVKWDCSVTQEIKTHINNPNSNRTTEGASSRRLQIIPFSYLLSKDVKLQTNQTISQSIPHDIEEHQQNYDPLPSSFQESLPFRKVYDELDRGSILGGTCGEGHLLYEGVLQHQVLGSILAQTYRTLIDPDQVEKQIYVRASDFQRTSLSATAQVTSYLKESLGYSYPKLLENQKLLLHTRDIGLESMFPNLVSCRALLGLRERVVASNEYQALEKRYDSLRQRLQQALRLADIPKDITGNIYDCLMTTICSNQLASLPPGIRPSATYSVEDSNGNVVQKSLLDETFEAVDAISNFEYTWKNGKFSTVAMVRFMCDFKAKILAGIRAELSKSYRGADLLTQLKQICKCDPQELLDYGEEKPKEGGEMERLIFFVGHDTTILPFLASLQVFDGKWPPYASQIIMEISKFGKNEFYFRLMYNGKLLNDRLNGCDTQYAKNIVGADLCPISYFFAATSWAIPSNAVTFCEVVNDNDK